MYDVAWHRDVNCVRSKDAQKQLARTSLITAIHKLKGPISLLQQKQKFKGAASVLFMIER